MPFARGYPGGHRDPGRQPHREFVVSGVVHIAPPGPAGSPTPAVVCLSANGYHMLDGQPIGGSDGDSSGHGSGSDAEGFVLCRVPPEGVDVPFTTSQYTTESHHRELLLLAYLVSVVEGVPGCDGDAVSAMVEPALVRGVCSASPAKTEIAQLLPSYDDGSRPTDTISIAAQQEPPR